jgi:hypothetical protein
MTSTIWRRDSFRDAGACRCTDIPFITISVADPDPRSGVFLTLGSWMGKKSRSGSGLGMIIPDHISESLKTILLVKILKFFDADAHPDLGSGMEKILIRGRGTLRY